MTDGQAGFIAGVAAVAIAAVCISFGACADGHKTGVLEGRCLERGGQLVDGKCAKVEVMP